MKCKDSACPSWEPGRKEEDCETCIDGRDLEVVNIYASTCDGCAKLTLHELMHMNEETQLGYCEKCAKEIDLIKGEKK